VDRVDEAMLRCLLRVARRTAGGHAGTALRLAVAWAWEHPTLSRAIESCVATGDWGRLVADELTERASPPLRRRDAHALARVLRVD
jgi:hypothetical protein